MSESMFSQQGPPSAFQAVSTVIKPKSVCVECNHTPSGEAAEAKKLQCAACQCMLCGESCESKHTSWCTTQSAVLAKLFDGNIGHYYGFLDSFRANVQPGQLFFMNSFLSSIAPAYLTDTERTASSWAYNRVCVDVECLFFALVAARFPGNREKRYQSQFYWHVNVTKTPLAGLPDVIGTPYPITVVTEGGTESARRVGWYKFDLRGQIAIDLQQETANVAYLLQLADQEPPKGAARDHLFVIRVVGRRAYVVQSYARHYTFAQWCDWEQPLQASPGRRSAAVRHIPRYPVDAQPPFRGVLDENTTNRLAGTLVSLIEAKTQADRNKHWRSITGVADTSAPAIRIGMMRFDLHGWRI